MNLLLIILIVVLLIGVPGGWRYGGPYLGGGVGLVGETSDPALR